MRGEMDEIDIKEGISRFWCALCEQRPLVHQITNEVTINDCANATLAIGASPVMTRGRQDAPEMAGQASALVLNLGTITEETLDVMITAGKKANASTIPVILDPVGAGATAFRTYAARQLLHSVQISVIKGNASEMESLLGGTTRTRGVDAVQSSRSQSEIAIEVASVLCTVVAVTGQKDAISNGDRTIMIGNGHPLLAAVTGTGCMTGALIGSFAGAGADAFSAAVAGVSLMGIAGERAFASMKEGEGSGTFRVRLIDQLSLMNSDLWQKGVKVSEY